MTDNEVPIYGDDDDDLLSRLQEFDGLLDTHWGQWVEETRENYAMVAGDQWDEDAREMMLSTNRQPITFNRIEPTIDAVSGAEVMNRQEVSYQPRQTSDSGVAELETGAAKWVRDECDAEHEESEAFRDMLICGMGWTQTRRDQEEQPDTQLVIERVDPTEMAVDPVARKRNCADARFLRRKRPMSRCEFEEKWPDDSPDGPEKTGKRVTIVDPELRYHNGPLQETRDEVYVNEYQWFDVEPEHVRVMGDDGGMMRVPPEVYAQVSAQTGQDYQGQHVPKRRVYYRAFMAGGRILPFDTGQQVEELMFGPDELGGFTYCCMTGKRDRNNGTWYGLVKPMKDPQRFANKFFSQINHILATNAKGGMIIEDGAVKDIREFEENWSSSDRNTVVNAGALKDGRLQPKPQTPYPAGLSQLMEYSVGSIRDVTGVNLETLGLAEREQAGVLEQQRKQQTFGLLSTYFDSERLYRKRQGRVMLAMMQEFIAPGTLVRLQGQDGLAQYVPFFTQPGVTAFDIIVDDAPAGPNQKQITFNMLLQLIQVVGPQNVPPDVWPEVIRNSPLPTPVAERIAAAITAQQQAPPSPAAQLEMADKQAKIGKTQADTQKSAADAERTRVETSLLPAEASTDHAEAAAGIHFDNRMQIVNELKAVADAVKANQPQDGQFY